jgi:hypothetical protein
VLPPSSLLGALDPAAVKAAGEASPLWATYAQEIDRESATELLAAKMGVPGPAATASATAAAGGAEPKPKPTVKTGSKKAGAKKPDTSPVTDYLKSREGRSMLNTIARGVFSMLKK